jgi:hypothetical protein
MKYFIMDFGIVASMIVDHQNRKQNQVEESENAGEPKGIPARETSLNSRVAIAGDEKKLSEWNVCVPSRDGKCQLGLG